MRDAAVTDVKSDENVTDEVNVPPVLRVGDS
jgi:hypothetical protein